MNKKVIILIIILIIAIIAVIYIFTPKEDNSNTTIQGNEITEEQYNEKMIENITKTLSDAGIEVKQVRSTTFLRELQGYEYSVIINGRETGQTIEIYNINAKERNDILGKDAKNGKVSIEGENSGIHILYHNILIANIADENLANQIMAVLEN